MADDISKKILIELDLNQDDAKSALADLKVKVDSVKASILQQKEAFAAGKVALQDYNTEIAASKVEQQQAKTAYDQLRLSILQANQANKDAKTSVQAASGSYDEAQKKLTALGRAIKSAQGSFESTDPAIKAQIQSYKKLNSELAAFDAKMGNHQRKVGQYENAIKGLGSQLVGLVPGLNKFSGILSSASQVFSTMGNSAKEAAEGAAAAGAASEGAEAGVAGLSVAAGVLVVAVAAVIGVLVGLWQYLKDIAPVSDKVSDVWAGMKAQATSLINTIRSDGFFGGKFMENMNNAYISAQKLNQAMIELNRQMVVSDVATNSENQFIATQMLKIRNLHTTAAEANKIFNEIQATAETQYKRVSHNAEAGFNIVANKIALTAALTKNELTELARDGVAAAEKFKDEGKHISDDLIEELAKFQNARISAEGLKDQVEQRAQNRAEQREARANQAAEKEKSQIAEITRATEEANSERIASLSRTLKFKQEAFAQELSESDEHYRQLIFKQQQFIEKQEQLANSKKSSPKVKAAANKAIGAGKSDITQLQKEQYAAQQKLLEDHSKDVLTETQKQSNELASLQIQSISDQRSREIAALNLSYKETNEGLDKELQAYKENDQKILDEMKTATAARKKILQGEHKHQQDLIGITTDKKVEGQEQHQKSITDTNKGFDQQNKLMQDQVDILNAGNLKGFFGGEDNPFNKTKENAELKEIEDQRQDTLSKAGLDGDKNKDGSDFTDDQNKKKEKIETEFDDKKIKKKADYAKKQKAQEIQAAQQIADATFQIFQNSIQRQAQAQQTYMELNKSRELQNSSLTSTQKIAINEKYRVEEGQAKVREFHQEQEIALAKAAIDTAAAIIKAAPNVPLEVLAAATGAIEIGVIASEKAPAYVTGGVHYVSSGTGALLKGPGTGTSDSMNARLSNGESIINAKSTSMFAPLLSEINQLGGGVSFGNVSQTKNPWISPGFASGGVFNTYTPTTDNGLRPIQVNSTSRVHPDDINKIVQSIQNMPAGVIDVKDINRQQQMLAQATDRANYGGK